MKWSINVLLMGWLVSLIAGCQVAEVLPSPLIQPIWGEIVAAHYDNPASVETIQVDSVYNNGVDLPICAGRFSLILQRTTLQGPVAYVDLEVPGNPTIQQLRLTTSDLVRYDFDAQWGNLLISFMTPYLAESFLWSWQAISTASNCPNQPPLKRGQTAPSGEFVVGTNEPPSIALEPPSVGFADPPEPTEKDLSFIIELAWQDAVDLDLGSQFMGATPSLGWQNRRWSMPNTLGYLVRDKNSNCLMAAQAITEEFHWYLRLPSDAEEVRYNDDLRFSVSYQDSCLQSYEQAQTILYQLNIITYVPIPVYEERLFPADCDLQAPPRDPRRCNALRFKSGYRSEKQVLASVADCEIGLGETWRFALKDIARGLPCETIRENVTEDVLLSGG